MLLILDSWVNGKMESVSWPRTVMVPGTATVTWADLVDVVPVNTAGYAVPLWMADVIAARDATVTAAAAAETSRVAAATAAASVPTEAELTATMAPVTTQVPPTLRNAVITVNGGTDPRFVEYFGGYMWGGNGSIGDIYRSADEGVTWQLYCNSWPGVGDEAFIGRIVPTSDGEVLVMSAHELRKSSGWANGNAATWSTSKITPNGTGIFNSFGLDGDGTKFIMVEYSATTWADSRYGYISTDSGSTFIRRYDSVLQIGTANTAVSHLHGACYDPISDRFYVGEGHGPGGGIHHSSNNGLTWAVAPGMRMAEDNGNFNAPTVIRSTVDGLVLGSDNGHNGLFGVVREADPMKQVVVQTWNMKTGRAGLVAFATGSWKDPRDNFVYVTFRAEYDDTRPAIAAGTAHSGGLVYEWPTLPSLGGQDSFFTAVRTGPNTMTAYALINGSPTTVRGSIGAPGSVRIWEADTGDVFGGHTTTDTSTAVGLAMVVGGQSVAIGAGAAATGADIVAVGYKTVVTADAGTAIGRLASAGNAGTAVGRGATAVSGAVAVGYGTNSSGTDAVTIGVNAKAVVSSIAIGSGADATGYGNTVALGAGTVVTRASQVAVGDRDVEVQSTTKGFVLASPDGTRYRIRVGNGGALSITVAA
ncbi:hypothetical protein [Cryobacterium cryoconiti]|uniref:Uncharacterized protein n=1 Tax=Cryobacterium cryoconiti TaxID=1259239 RepID=A0A4Y8JY60_9MICO|nr:hypothetical protein [Cryobacterium cryoconiti]TFD27535.1 hypothetical protein E3T49_13415 [Cryobacterium cryoconiti]